jgi:hypothetical protein
MEQPAMSDREVLGKVFGKVAVSRLDGAVCEYLLRLLSELPDPAISSPSVEESLEEVAPLLVEHGLSADLPSALDHCRSLYSLIYPGSKVAAAGVMGAGGTQVNENNFIYFGTKINSLLWITTSSFSSIFLYED